MGDWNAKDGSQEIPGITGKFGLDYKMNQLLLLFSLSLMSDSLQPNGLQQARLPCLSPYPRVSSNSCLLSWWGHPIILSSVLPSVFSNNSVFSNESAIHIRWPKYWSFIFSISPSSEYSGLISFRMDRSSLQPKGLSRVFSNTTVQKYQFFGAQLSL